MRALICRSCSTVSTSLLVSSLKACASSRDINSGRRLHGRARSRGDDANALVAAALVAMYCKCGSVEEARAVFEAMPAPSVACWTSLMLAYVECGRAGLALQLFSQEAGRRCDPDARSFVAALRACSSLAAECRSPSGKMAVLDTGLDIHRQASARGYHADIFVANTLMDLCSRSGCMVEARRVFDGIAPLARNVVSWTVLVAGFADNGDGEAGLATFQRMLDDPAGVRPDALTLVAALKSVVSLGAAARSKASGSSADPSWNVNYLSKGMEIHAMAVKAGLCRHLLLSNTLVDMYAKCAALGTAYRVFQQMPQHSVVSWTCLMLGLVDNGEEELSLKLFEAMIRVEGCPPDALTLVAALKACASAAAKEQGQRVAGAGTVVKLAALETAMSLHSQCLRFGLGGDARVGNMLVDLYAKCGSIVDARRVFDCMSGRDVVSCNSLMMGYVDAGEDALALEVFSWMMSQGCEHDGLSFVAALKACNSNSSLGAAKTIHARLLACEESIAPSDLPVVENALLDVYGKCGSMLNAQLLFDSLRMRTSFNWSTLIAGYARTGGAARVHQGLEAMLEEGWIPDGVLCLSVLSACSHAGSVDQGKKLFQAMSSEWNLTRELEHYRCMVDILGRANELDEAFAMAENMPFEADAWTWRTVLSACWKWRNAVVGNAAFLKLVQLDGSDEAAFALMANIYASLGMWKEHSTIEAIRRGQT